MTTKIRKILLRFYRFLAYLAVMKIVIAPDSFKECLSSARVASGLAAGARARWPEADVRCIPLADGGEGTLEVLAAALQADIREARVHDPLGRRVTAPYAEKGKTAVLEAASAVGLSLLAPRERAPLTASSAGLGELLLAAFDQGCRHFVIGLGGTATCDGGLGMLAVPGIGRLRDATMELLCDVDAPFLGPRGAARVFGPQKGAGPEAVELLERRMQAQADALLSSTGVDVSALPGAGAAGGLAGALIAVFGARYTRGIDRVLELVHFTDAVRGAHLILTGEGRSDAQTLMGKVPMGVLRHARNRRHDASAPPEGSHLHGQPEGPNHCGGVPVALLSGRIEDREALRQAGFSPIVEVSPRSLPLAQALNPTVAARNLRQAVLEMELPPLR